MKAAARTAGVPDRYAPARANTSSSYTASYPSRRSSAMPRSNDSRERGLAGDTTATRAPGHTARGFSNDGALTATGSRLQILGHLIGDPPVLVASQHPRVSGRRVGSDWRGQKALLHP